MFVIMMNPQHLVEDELNYELEKRNIRDIGGLDNRRRSLWRMLKDGRLYPMECPVVMIINIDPCVPLLSSVK